MISLQDLRALIPAEVNLTKGGIASVLLGLVAYAVYYAVFVAVPEATRKQGSAEATVQCVTASASAAVTSTAAGASAALTRAQADMTHANQASAANERGQARVITLYRSLESEARHAPPHPVDACTLPAERLRIWSAANAGPAGAADTDHQGQPASQPDAAASAVAPAGVGRNAGPGAEPPGGGPGLSSTGSSAVQPAAVPGD